MPFPPVAGTPDAVVEHQETPWHGRSAIDLVRFRQRRFDGTMSPPRTWEVLRRGTAAAVLPYDPWTDQVVLMQQFRLPALAAGLDPVMTEIPAGLIDPGETPEQTVEREITEEAGLHTDRLARVGPFLLSPGCSDELITIFVGRIRAPGPEGFAAVHGLAEENEDIRTEVLPAQRAIDQAVAGAYPNSVATIALLWLAIRRPTLRTEWLA